MVASGSIKYALNRWPSRTAGSVPAGPAICTILGWAQRPYKPALRDPTAVGMQQSPTAPRIPLLLTQHLAWQLHHIRIRQLLRNA